jgi:hypothetical protein
MLNNRALKITLMSTAFLLVAVCLSFARTDHKEYRGAKLEDCRDCHSGSGVMDNHGAFFMNEHKQLAQKASSNCADCHQQSFCLDCHKGGGLEADLQKSLSRRGEYMPKTHRSDFISIHAVKAADNPRDCYRCHESRFCSDCHNRQILRNRAGMSIKPHKPIFASPGVPDPAWVSDHRTDARRNLQSCQGCHPQKGDCTNFLCHPNLGGR